MIFPHDKPHFRRIAATAGPAHTLQKTGHSKGCINLKGTFQPADINTELQRSGCTNAQEGIIIFHFFFSTLPIRCREIAVVNEKTVRFPIHFAVLPEILTDGFAFFPGIGKNEALFSFCVFKDIPDPWICRFRSRICGGLEPRC